MPYRYSSQSPQREMSQFHGQFATIPNERRGCYTMDSFFHSLKLRFSLFKVWLVCLLAMISAGFLKNTLRKDTRVFHIFYSQSLNSFTNY